MNFGDNLLKLYAPLMAEALKLCKKNPKDKTTSTDKANAQDLVSTTMLKCLKNEDKFQEGTNLYAWAVTVLRNQNKDLIRKKSPDIVDPDTLINHPEAEKQNISMTSGGSDPVLKLSIERCLDGLTEIRRTVLILNGQGQTAREISELLGFPINTALSHLARAKKAFGACIDPEGNYA